MHVHGYRNGNNHSRYNSTALISKHSAKLWGKAGIPYGIEAILYGIL